MSNPEIKIRRTWERETQERGTQERGTQARKKRWEERKVALRELGFTKETVIKDLSRRVSAERVKESIESLMKICPDERWALKVIEKFPQLPKLDIKKGRMKIEFANNLLESYQFPKISEKEMLEKFPQFVSYDSHKITFSFLILGELSKKLPKEEKSSSAPKIIGIGRDLSAYSPYLVFSVLEKKRPRITEDEDGVMKAKCDLITDVRKIEKKERRKIIDEVKENLPKTLENLKGSKDPYDNEFLSKLAQQLLYKESKEKNENLR